MGGANNLSTLGESAAQLPNYLGTVSSALVWMPSTGEKLPSMLRVSRASY